MYLEQVDQEVLVEWDHQHQDLGDQEVLWGQWVLGGWVALQDQWDHDLAWDLVEDHLDLEWAQGHGECPQEDQEVHQEWFLDPEWDRWVQWAQEDR